MREQTDRELERENETKLKLKRNNEEKNIQRYGTMRLEKVGTIRGQQKRTRWKEGFLKVSTYGASHSV